MPSSMPVFSESSFNCFFYYSSVRFILRLASMLVMLLREAAVSGVPPRYCVAPPTAWGAKAIVPLYRTPHISSASAWSL